MDLDDVTQFDNISEVWLIGDHAVIAHGPEGSVWRVTAMRNRGRFDLCYELQLSATEWEERDMPSVDEETAQNALRRALLFIDDDR